MGEAGLRPEADVPLAPHTTLGVGGPARWLARAADAADVEAAHRWCGARGEPLTVLGGGSNVVVADAGVPGLVLQMAGTGVEVTAEGEACLLAAGAGVPWGAIVDEATGRGLAGVECLAGIPGSVGGTPIQNVGAYGQEVAAVVDRVEVFDRTAGEATALTGGECGFGYRTSRFKGADAGRFVVCAVRYRLRPGAATAVYPDVVRFLEATGIEEPGVADVRDAVLAIRRRKGMVLDPGDPDTRSVGSFFVNPVVGADAHARLRAAHGEVPAVPQPGGAIKVPAAWLIERAGFERGFRAGPVGVSGKHPLAIVAGEGATAGAVVDLAVRIKRAVAGRFGIGLVAEPVFVGFGEDARVEYLRGTE